MDLELSETQKALQTAARSFLESECPWTVVRDLHDSHNGYSPEMWLKMAELGWTGLLVPEKYEGAGGGFMDLVALLEEMGRALLPSPFVSTALLGTQALLLAGSDEQRASFLPQISKGQLITALALLEANPDYKATSINTRAELSGDDYLIQGTKLFVRDAHIADYLICAAKTDSKAEPRDAISLFLVKRDSPGIACTKLNTIGNDRQCEVIFDQARVPKDHLLGKLNRGWDIVERILQYATLAECAEMLGLAQKVLDMSVQYAKERVQFDHPIGSFQAIQHMCADMATYVEGCRWMTWYTVWEMEQGLPCAVDISRTKVWASESVQRVVRHGQQIYGGVGFTLEYPMHLYFRRAKCGEVMYGNPEWHRRDIADALLG
jgi:alkylation response protein AidB-like acyl-CoA dehydrogenase